MEPLNHPERTKAIRNFMSIYGLSLLVVITIVYFLFNTPASLFKSRMKLYELAGNEQEQLLTKVAAMTTNLKNIIQADQTYLSSSNEIEKGSLLGNLQEYQKDIGDKLVDVKNDSAGFSSPVVKKDSYNYIVAFNSIVAYRNTITSLQKTLEEKGGDATELLKIKSQLDGCTTQLEIYKAMANKPVVAAAPAAGGGGSSAKEAQLQQLLDKSQADLAACQKAKAGTVAPVPVEPSGSAETKKAVILFEAAEDLYNNAEKTRNLIEKRGVLSSAKQLFQKAGGAYPDADKLNKAINQIDIELKKLSNMG